MCCLGVFIDTNAQRSLFNFRLALEQGKSLIERNDFGGDPELVRQNVEAGLRRSHPFVTVAFWDSDAEQEADAPNEDGGYCLMIKQETPIYSARMH